VFLRRETLFALETSVASSAERAGDVTSVCGHYQASGGPGLVTLHVTAVTAIAARNSSVQTASL